jgi:hypothetical protein
MKNVWPFLILLPMAFAVVAFKLMAIEVAEIDAVNRCLPEERRFSPGPHGRYWNDRGRLREEYRRLFPDAPLEAQRRRWLAAVMLLGVAFALTAVIAR